MAEAMFWIAFNCTGVPEVAREYSSLCLRNTFNLMSISGKNFILSNTLVCEKIPAKLTLDTSSAVL